MTSSKTKQHKCVCCGSMSLTTIIKLSPCPLSDNYQDTSVKSLALTYYPCNLQLCNDCGHSQLESFVEPDESYSEYIYKSKVTLGLNDAFDEYSKKVKEIFGDTERIDLLDIGSNDGSFISSCSSDGINAYGVEPAENLVKACKGAGLKVKQGFFDKNFKINVDDDFPGKFDVVTFNNVLANIAKPQEALITAKHLLKDYNSMIVVQTGYHPLLFSKGLFDYIYHEHFSYFSIKSLNTLAESIGLELVKYEQLQLRGGSIRAFLRQKQSEITKSITPKYERFTCKSELSDLKCLINYSALRIKEKLDSYLEKGFEIIGYGASHSTGMLVHMFGLEPYLSYLVDENQDKVDKYMPGTSLIVQNSNDLKPSKQTIVIVLAWQYYEQIKTKLINKGFSADAVLKPMLP
tara:strand:+ start:34894 stop:36108 length:1215 start_codon:yes stop_codon:yes gene_type:complete